jgi:hypothetical protein
VVMIGGGDGCVDGSSHTREEDIASLCVAQLRILPL